MKHRHKPEEIVAKVRETEMELVRAEPAGPWRNPFSKTFHSRARDEFLEREVFGSLLEAKVLCEI